MPHVQKKGRQRIQKLKRNSFWEVVLSEMVVPWFVSSKKKKDKFGAFRCKTYYNHRETLFYIKHSRKGICHNKVEKEFGIVTDEIEEESAE